MNETYQTVPLGAMFSTLAALVWPNAGRPEPRSPHAPGLRLENSRHARPIETLRLWRERVRQRHELSLLDDHILQDIGLTREQVDTEVRRPFWRA